MGKCTFSIIDADHCYMALGEVRDNLDRACRVLTALRSLPEPALLGPAEDPRVPVEVARSLEEILALRALEREHMREVIERRSCKKSWSRISARVRHALRGLVLSGRRG